MSFNLASAILRGKWLIEPEFAHSQLPLVVELIKAGATDKGPILAGSSVLRPEVSHPTKISFAASQTDVYSVNPYTSTDRLPYNSIAMIDIVGPIIKYGGWCSYGTVQMNDLIIRLSNSDRVKGIILNIDSGGGQADGTGMFAETIRKVRKIKPVITVIQDGIAASAAYWIGSSAQEVYLTRDTDMVGSIGAYTTIYDFSGYFEQLGIIVRDIYAPESKDKNKDYKDALKGDDKAIEDQLSFLVQDFKKSVSEGRGDRLKVKGEEPFTGKMYFAKEAKALGLIDGVKPMSGVIQRMEELIALRS